MRRRLVTGWTLAPTDRAALLKRVPPRFADVVADHVTLRTGTDATTPLPAEDRGAVIGEIDDGCGVQALVVRIGGTVRREDGGVFHLTWSLDKAAGRQAKESNDVIARLGWRALPAPLPIRLVPARF